MDGGKSLGTERGEWLWALAFALVLGRGLFHGTHALGIGDWDYFVSHAQAAYTSVFVYGQAPLWSPFHCGGEALFENFQSRVFSPSLVLVLVFGPNLGSRLAMWLWLVVGFEGARRFARMLGADPWAARFAALATAGNGAVLAHAAIGHFGEMPYLAWPWWLIALRRAEDDRARGALAGGLWLALSYLEAGIYPLVHGALLAIAWTVGRTLRTRDARPVLALVAVGAAALGLSAYVLVPSALRLLSHPRELVEAEVVPLSGLVTMLLSPDMRLRGARFAGQAWDWHEYAAYVGPVFVVALALALVRARRDLRIFAFVIAGALFVGWVLGDFAPISPWTVGHRLPVLSSMRASGRAMLPALFCFACAIALGLRDFRFTPWLVGAFALNLALVVPHALDDVFSRPLEVARDDHFTQRAELGHFRLLATEGYSRMTEDVLRHRGALRCYEPTPWEHGAKPRWPKADEVWLEPEVGAVRTAAWSPQRVAIALSDVTRPALLLLNQNYHPGWVREDGGPTAATRGVVSTVVEPGTKRVVFVFEAPLFRALCAISLASLLGLLAWAARERLSARRP